MKTKKVLALLVLAAMIMSIVPAMAFGAINVDVSRVIPPEGTKAAVAGTYGAADGWNGTADGQVFTVMLTRIGVGAWASDDLWVATNRPNSDSFFYMKSGVWELIPKADEVSGSPGTYKLDLANVATNLAGSTTTREMSFKVISTAAGTSQIAFGITPTDTGTYGTGAVNTYQYANSRTADAAAILANENGGKRNPITFTSPRAAKISVEGPITSLVANSVADYTGSDKAKFGGRYEGKYGNGVDSYTVTATVLTGSEVPVNGQDVTWTIVSGTGASLSVTRSTTNTAGRADVKVYSTRQGDVTVRGRTSIGAGTDYGFVIVNFASTGIIRIKDEDPNNQKVARSTGDPKTFAISAYDANGNRVDFTKMGIPENRYKNATTVTGNPTADMYIGAKDSAKKLELYAEIVKKPSGASLVAGNLTYGVDKWNGNVLINVPWSGLNRDGEYEIKVYLPNGNAVIYTFNVKDQGDIVRLELDYGSTSYAAGSYLPSPWVKTYDEEDYSVWKKFDVYNADGGDGRLSLSDASYLDGKIADDGSFKLKDDKSGPIYMTLVDRTLNLVARQDLEIRKPASYLKLTAPSVTAVGGEASIDIELVDIDGNLAAVGLDSAEARATIIPPTPEGAIASASEVDASKFASGKANVKVSSNVEGDINVRVIITETTKPVPGKIVYQEDPAGNYILDNDGNPEIDTDLTEYYGGRTYTGATTVAFGKVSEGGGTLIFMIGAPSFVAGIKPYAAESPAFIENGRTFLGVRDIGTAIGATIEWDQDSQTATISKDVISVKVTVGADTIAVTKNGVTTEVSTDAAAINKDGRVYLPFRLLLEAFGYTVTWDEATQAIICTI